MIRFNTCDGNCGSCPYGSDCDCGNGDDDNNGNN